MTEMDFVEALNLHASNGINAFAIYSTLTFAFLSAIYVAGAKLSKIEILLLSFLYLTWAVSFSMGAIVHMQSLEALLREYPSFVRARLWYAPWSIMGTAMTGTGVVVCFLYVRKTIRQSAGVDHGNT
tara:strand:+ start:142 stop:522 length:381 start_codon:yes stop_codon:yes gene_type:complete